MYSYYFDSLRCKLVSWFVLICPVHKSQTKQSFDVFSKGTKLLVTVMYVL